jgi:exopolysaccharide biosynthesis polyprenyl glycosylphosphotransferase
VLIQQRSLMNSGSVVNLPSFHPALSLKKIPFLLLVSDFLGIVFCLKICAVFGLGDFKLDLDLLFFGFLILVLLGLYLGDTYRPDSQLEGLRAPARILVTNVLIGCVTATSLYFIGLWRNTSFLTEHNLWLPSLLLFTLWAVLTRIWSATWIRNHVDHCRWLLVENNSFAEGCHKTLLSQPSIGQFTILRSQLASASAAQSIANCDSLDRLSTYLEQPWTGVIISEHTQLSDNQTRILMEARLRGVQVMSPQDFHENFRFRIPADTLKDSWFLLSAGFNLFRGRVSWKLKRVFDVCIASLLLLFLAPVMLLAAIAVKLDSPGSIFYSQTRTGLNGESFRVYKFRSMYQDAEKRGAQWASERDPRITRVGYWLRILRIDELPQIWNVLKGEMSLIGPRPERPEFDVQLAEAIPYYQLRYLVKPGITGWAQVMYPYGASVEDAYEKFAYDLYYIKNFSFWLDIAIVLKTIRVVFLGKGR